MPGGPDLRSQCSCRALGPRRGSVNADGGGRERNTEITNRPRGRARGDRRANCPCVGGNTEAQQGSTTCPRSPVSAGSPRPPAQPRVRCGPSPNTPTHQHPATHRAGPVAAAALVAPAPMALVAFLKVTLCLDLVSQEPAASGFTAPTPAAVMSPPQVEGPSSRASVGRGPFLLDYQPRGPECQA